MVGFKLWTRSCPLSSSSHFHVVLQFFILMFESALCICGSVHSQRIGHIYTQNLGLFFSDYLNFSIFFLFPNIYSCPELCPLALLAGNSVFIRILYTACSIPFPSFRCQLFTTFDYSFQSPLPLGFFAFSLQFIVVTCRSVGLTGVNLAISETKSMLY